MISVIIPIIYRPDLARMCIDSLIRYSNGLDIEIIAVWEGDNADVGSMLDEYHTIKVVRNSVRKGFAGAMNSGLAVATGDYICFLNDDTVVTPGCLDSMIGAFKDEKSGLVAPRISEIGPIEKGMLDYESVDSPTALKGVCFMLPKRVLDEIGAYDEALGIGGGEDNDLCMRVLTAGYKCVLANKAFLYHYGSASFREEFKGDVDYSKKYAVQQFNKYREKHNLKDTPSVFIAIPTTTGTINSQLAIRLVEWSHLPNVKIKIRFYNHLAPLDNARNVAVKEFLEEYSDYILFIDDDIVPPANALQQLISHDKEVVAPLCFTTRTDDRGLIFPVPVAHRYDDNREYRPYYGKDLEETDTITGGMFLVKRKIMEQLERPFYFTYHKNGTVIYSEDFVFSQQCQSLGYRLFTDFSLLCKHYKTVDIKQINDLLVSQGGK